MTNTIERHEFQAEVKQVLELVIHSLYSNKDIFLRELISNASDAIGKLQFESLTNKDLLKEDHEFEIRLSSFVNDDSRILCIEDNGIGMSHDELIKNLGTIAKSGSKEFLELIKQNQAAQANPELIGQFGVGFYSAFMVADRVTVISQKAGESQAYAWQSSADASYTIQTLDEARTGLVNEIKFDADEITAAELFSLKHPQGTKIILEIKEDQVDFTREYKLRNIVQQYSDYVEHPIKLRVKEAIQEEASETEEAEEKETKYEILWETLNSRKAIWTKAKSDVSEEEYKDFYQHISHDFKEPLTHIHYSAEGTNEFKALIYIPSKAPMDLFMPEHNKGLNLYIKRIFITNKCEALLENYLRFICGVVDASDLPLNVSREMMQDNPRLSAIKKSITKKVLSELSTLKNKDKAKYLSFYKEFGRVLKEGVHTDFANKDKIMDLLAFESSKTESQTKDTEGAVNTNAYITLQEYVERMQPDQKEIYYITGESRTEVENSPYMEAFKQKGLEVIFMLDPIDEWVVMSSPSFKEKTFKSISKANIELDENEKKEKEAKQEEFKDLLAKVKNTLADKVKDVQFSSRLVDTLCCLVADEMGMSAHMERLYKAAQQDLPTSKRILELNANHPVLTKLNELFTTDANNQQIADYSELIYNQALLMEGSKIEDPVRFAKLLNDLMV